MKKKLLLWFIPAAIIIIIALIPSRKGASPPSEAPPVNVTVMTVKSEPQIPDTFDLPAVIEPNRIIRISAEVAGRIENLPVKKGTLVHSGDLLIRINDDLLLPEFQSAQAQLARDQIEFERQTNLVKEGSSTQRDLDNATSALAISKARLAQIRAQLERTRIAAPAAAMLNNLLVEQGEYVQVGTALAELVEIDTVKAVVEVPERDIGFFSTGQTAEVAVNVKGEEELIKGKIFFISKLADERTRSTPMEIILDNKAGLLQSGQIVRVKLTRRILKDAIFIPLLAVIPLEEGKAVYIVNNSQAHRQDVELGIIKGDRIQITKGLKSGDRLIVAGHRFISPDQKVNIVSEPNAPVDASADEPAKK